MPFLPPNQQCQSTEVIIQLVINPSNTAIFPTDCKQNNLLSIAFSSFLSMHIRIQAQYCSTRVTLDNNYRFCYICTVYAKYAGHSLRPFDNAQRHVTAFRPITEAARSLSYENEYFQVTLSADKTQIETTQSACYQSDITRTQHQLHHVRLNIS